MKSRGVCNFLKTKKEGRKHVLVKRLSLDLTELYNEGLKKRPFGKDVWGLTRPTIWMFEKVRLISKRKVKEKKSGKEISITVRT